MREATGVQVARGTTTGTEGHTETEVTEVCVHTAVHVFSAVNILRTIIDYLFSVNDFKFLH